MNKEEQDGLRARSGCVKHTDRLASFLYDLMRDHLPTGTVEKLVQKAASAETTYTNGWLASYARDLSRRLFTEEDAIKEIQANVKILTDVYLSGGSGDCVDGRYYDILNKMRDIVQAHDNRMMRAKGFIPK